MGGFLEADVKFDLPVEVPDQQITDTDVIVKIPGTNYALKFPKDGSQPTTEDAVKNACANVNNDENSRITQFYMKLYGVIPYKISSGEEYYYDLGFDENGAAQKIIYLDGSFNSKLVPDPWISGEHITKHNLFHRAFRKLASTSVGRTLLYRLLIEIRRHGNDVLSLSSDAKVKYYQVKFNTERELSAERKRNTSILITYNNNKLFQYERMTHSIAVSCATHPSTVISEQSFCLEEKKDIDISLFHEMNHWFHFLRHPRRYLCETAGGSAQPDQKDAFRNGSSLSTWSLNDEEFVKLKAGKEGKICNEEMRNILGVNKESKWYDLFKLHSDESDIVVNGDDLCENLYRLCRGEKSLRFGHTLATPQVDCTTIYEQVMKSLKVNQRYYSIG